MHTTQLQEIDRSLRSLTNEDERARPFVCNGSPLDCRVFIVGINPASKIPFWKYWSAETGFDKELWEREYLENKGRWSPTRLRINRLSRLLLHVSSCLETNIFWYPTPEEKSLNDKYRDTAVFDYLLKTIKPKVAIIHGKTSCIKAMPMVKSHGVESIEAKHFSRISYEEIDRLAAQVCRQVRGQAPPKMSSSKGV